MHERSNAWNKWLDDMAERSAWKDRMGAGRPARPNYDEPTDHAGVRPSRNGANGHAHVPSGHAEGFQIPQRQIFLDETRPVGQGNGLADHGDAARYWSSDRGGIEVVDGGKGTVTLDWFFWCWFFAFCVLGVLLVRIAMA